MGALKSSLKSMTGETDGEVSDDLFPDSSVLRTLDGRNSMKLRSGLMKCSWKKEIPEIFILQDVIRIQDKRNNIIELRGEQEEIWLGGFQITTRCILHTDGSRRGYALGVNTKILNLATFEIEVQDNGNIILSGRKLKNTKEGQLRLITLPDILPSHIHVDALDNNRIVWIRIYSREENSNDPENISAISDTEETGRNGSCEYIVRSIEKCSEMQESRQDLDGGLLPAK